MKYKYLGKTGIKVSELCFGTMSFGANADKNNSKAMYKQVRDAGLLTGKYGVDRTPDSGRLVDNAMYSTRYEGAFYLEIAEKFSQLAEKRGFHPASLAVAWTASHAAVTTPIIGAGNSEQLTPSLESVNIGIDDEIKIEIDKISSPSPPATDRTEEQTKFNYGAMLQK